jgi:cAMP-binding proteins - catabolite gene activator and regulatory subunit of cAMP-dependent protein kinases
VITEIATRRPFLDAALTARETLQHLPAGTTLFDEGAQPRGVYLVHSGAIELYFQTRTGALKRVRSASVGEILGLGSVVSCRPHEYTALAITTSELGFIDKDVFLKMLNESHAIWFTVLRLLSQDVNTSYGSLRNAASARA